MKSIRTVLLFWVFTTTILFSLVLSVVNYLSARSIILDGIKTQLVDSVNLARAETDSWLNMKVTEVETMANTHVIRSGDRDSINAYLGEALDTQGSEGSYSSFWVSDMEGNWYSPPLGTFREHCQQGLFSRGSAHQKHRDFHSPHRSGRRGLGSGGGRPHQGGRTDGWPAGSQCTGCCPS